MRAVSFVKRFQWDLPGTVCRHGLTIGDVDNDGDNELIVGTAEGELYIFKVNVFFYFSQYIINGSLEMFICRATSIKYCLFLTGIRAVAKDRRPWSHN